MADAAYATPDAPYDGQYSLKPPPCRKECFAYANLADSCTAAESVLSTTSQGTLFGVRKHVTDGRDQSVEFNRLRVELVTSRGDSFVTFAGQRVCGHSDDRNTSCLRICL